MSSSALLLISLLLLGLAAYRYALAARNTIRLERNDGNHISFDEFQLYSNGSLVPFADISADAIQWIQAQVQTRRPALGAIFEEAVGAKAAPAGRPSVIALTCGPHAMVDEVSELCFAHNVTFHSEEFHF